MNELRPYQKMAVKECWDALKINNEPVLLMASVGSGKSLMIASILLSMQKYGKRALCIVNNAELVRNNCSTFINEGGNASIYCASLENKDCSAPVVFGTPQTILNGINKNETIASITFNLIVVDEAHSINYLNPRSSFIRILRHYRLRYDDMRLLGATGTNFRFRGTSIVGSDCLFKTQVGNITTESLIHDNYLIEPTFEVDKNLLIDFSGVKIKQNGQFDKKQLESVIEKSARLTELICKQIVHIMETQKRFGVFLFATTKKHAFEILSHLPFHQSALILGETPQEERTIILDKARTGQIRYLVNIAIVSVGVDVPSFDTIAYLRPTESLVLLVQTMGRALRLSPGTGKKEALVLDFSGNIERHRDWDNPILLDAVKQTLDIDKPHVIQCPACQMMNTEHARRCVGMINNKRCDYYFEFKSCPNDDCKAQNDIASRLCRICDTEIIDPNAKLNMEHLASLTKEVTVKEVTFSLSGGNNRFRVSCGYLCHDNQGKNMVINEHFFSGSEKAKHVFYGQFVKKHCDNSSFWYPHLANKRKVKELLEEANVPNRLLMTREGKIKKKFFD